MKNQLLKLVSALVLLFALTTQGFAYQYPYNISNLGDFVGSSGSLYSDSLSGLFSATGVGYEAGYFNTFTGGGEVIFDSSMTPDGVWSDLFDWSTAGFSSNIGAGAADHYLVYVLNQSWSPDGILSFAAGTFIIGYGDGTDDGDFDDLIIAASPVPVPAALWLFGSGLLGMVAYRRRRTA